MVGSISWITKLLIIRWFYLKILSSFILFYIHVPPFWFKALHYLHWSLCKVLWYQLVNVVCVWISLILLKTENNKKSFFGYCSLLKLLFTCLFALFMSQVKKKKKKPEMRTSKMKTRKPNKYVMSNINLGMHRRIE